jgi:hypothetical protein
LAAEIVVEGVIAGSPSVTLPEGTTLRGGELAFLAKGVRLTRNNTLRDITITTVPYEVAVYNDTSVPDAGTLRFENVSTVGQVYLVAENATTRVRVEAMGLHVREADVRGRIEQPHGYGVDVLQGGLTLWNRQQDPASKFTATLRDVSVGTDQTPVRGSGVFVAGYGDREGKLAGGAFEADLIETGKGVTDGGIAPGTPDKITGGVFVVSGATVGKVLNAGTVTTHGQNDMVLDNWGYVKEWVSTAEITSTGPSGIGFVNFGDIDRLDVQAPILTTGPGARGFNLYDGSGGSGVSLDQDRGRRLGRSSGLKAARDADRAPRCRDHGRRGAQPGQGCPGEAQGDRLLRQARRTDRLGHDRRLAANTWR